MACEIIRRMTFVDVGVESNVEEGDTYLEVVSAIGVPTNFSNRKGMRRSAPVTITRKEQKSITETAGL